MKSSWIDTKDCEPLMDGEYMVQSIYGSVMSMNYTLEGGWNTHALKDGSVSEERSDDEKKDWSEYVARWFSIPTPPDVPTEWVDAYAEYLKRRR